MPFLGSKLWTSKSFAIDANAALEELALTVGPQMHGRHVRGVRRKNVVRHKVPLLQVIIPPAREDGWIFLCGLVGIIFPGGRRVGGRPVGGTDKEIQQGKANKNQNEGVDSLCAGRRKTE